MTEDRITYTPLMHLFLGNTWLEQLEYLREKVTYDPYVLFFGRLELYKGVKDLIMAWARMPEELSTRIRLILAGRGSLDKLWKGPLPLGIEVRNGLIQDQEALELFQHCAFLVLPYIGATQSALIPTAYFFHKAVIATHSGALPEYVAEGKTGWIVAPQHPPSLTRVLTEALSDFEQLSYMGQAGAHWYEEQRKIETKVVKHMYTHLAR
jgi:glycosyltransferase involved in cell wall biosynthesis